MPCLSAASQVVWPDRNLNVDQSIPCCGNLADSLTNLPLVNVRLVRGKCRNELLQRIRGGVERCAH